MDFVHRLRELDSEVERLRAALAALQQHLEASRAARPQPGPATRAGSDEWLRAYA